MERSVEEEIKEEGEGAAQDDILARAQFGHPVLAVVMRDESP